MAEVELGLIGNRSARRRANTERRSPTTSASPSELLPPKEDRLQADPNSYTEHRAGRFLWLLGRSCLWPVDCIVSVPTWSLFPDQCCPGGSYRRLASERSRDLVQSSDSACHRYRRGDVDLCVDSVSPFLERVALSDPAHHERRPRADRTRDAELGLSGLRRRPGSHRHRDSESSIEWTHAIRTDAVARERRLARLVTPQHPIPRRRHRTGRLLDRPVISADDEHRQPGRRPVATDLCVAGRIEI